MKTFVYKILCMSIWCILLLLSIYSCGFNEQPNISDNQNYCDHEIIEHEAKEPTCKEAGYEKYESCAKCNYTTYKELPRLEHTYHYYFCTECEDELKASEGLSFTSTNFGTCAVTGIGECKDINLVIPMYSPNGDVVTKIADHAFLGNTSIISVTLPETIESIGEDAFFECEKIFEVINYSPIEITSGWDTNGRIARYAEYVHNGELKYKPNIKDGFAFVSLYGVNYLVSYLGENKQITLPTSYNEEPYLIHQSAFLKNSTIESVVISEGVLDIDYMSFKDCANLKKVSISKTVESIGQDAFLGCKKLERVEIENGVEFIGHNAFEYCEKLSVINLPKTITSIGEGTFGHCLSLNELTLPENLDFVKYRTFSGCKNLKSIIIPQNVAHIEARAFEDCISLKSVTIGRSVERIYGEAFLYCKNLENISVDEQNDFFTSIDGSLYSKNGKTIIKYAEGKPSDSFVVPSGVTEINKNAFAGCEKLRSITLPEGIEEIYDESFAGCKKLLTITIPNSVKKIGAEAFVNCERLVSITIGEGVSQIGSFAFYGTNIFEVINHSNLNITASMQTHGNIAASAKTVHKGESKLTFEGDYVFANHGTKNYLLAYIGTDTSITLPESFMGKSYYIHDNAFIYSDIISVTIPNKVISIGSYAFYGSKNLLSVTFLNAPPQIESDAFYDCNRLVEIICPNTSYFEIGSSLHGGIAANAKEIHSASSKISKVGDFVFIDSDDVVYLVAYLGKDQNVILPKNANGKEYAINSYAFEEYEHINSIFAQEGVIAFNDYAFYKCYSLKSIIMAKSVTDIGFCAFDATDLQSVYYYGTKSDFNRVHIDSNEQLIYANIYYYGEREPDTDGLFWCFDENGNVLIW